LVLFQIICLIFLPIAYVSMARVDPETWWLTPPIFLAAWIGEASSVAFYGFYHYSDAWWFKVAGVPLLVPLIWPMVILSGRAVLRRLWPGLQSAEPLAVGAIVFFDAAMVEVVAVQCGLWTWTEPGYLGVPLIGVVGWALFAFAVALVLRETSGRGRWLLIPSAPALLHLLLFISWWLCFRWFWRGDWFVLFVAYAAVLTLIALVVRRRGRMALDLAGVRMIAGGIFVVLLVAANLGAGRVWLHVLLTSIPYALITDFQRKMFAGRPAAIQSAVQTK
jgi:hypothetical protein